MKEEKGFEEYWNTYGELHASMCGGSIKQFAKEIWMSARSSIEQELDGEEPKKEVTR